MERVYKVTAKGKDGSYRDWTCEGWLTVFSLIDKEFDCDTDPFFGPLSLERDHLVLSDNVAFKDGHRPCEIVIERVNLKGET